MYVYGPPEACYSGGHSDEVGGAGGDGAAATSSHVMQRGLRGIAEVTHGKRLNCSLIVQQM